jgi:hypothetical protein
MPDDAVVIRKWNDATGISFHFNVLGLRLTGPSASATSDGRENALLTKRYRFRFWSYRGDPRSGDAFAGSKDGSHLYTIAMMPSCDGP